MRIRFRAVKIRGVRRWMEGGKRRQETKVFFKTISPFNTNAAGVPKAADEIVAELRAEREAWLARATDKQSLTQAREAWSTREVDRQRDVVVVQFEPAEVLDKLLTQPTAAEEK